MCLLWSQILEVQGPPKFSIFRAVYWEPRFFRSLPVGLHKATGQASLAYVKRTAQCRYVETAVLF